MNRKKNYKILTTIVVVIFCIVALGMTIGKTSYQTIQQAIQMKEESEKNTSSKSDEIISTSRGTLTYLEEESSNEVLEGNANVEEEPSFLQVDESQEQADDGTAKATSTFIYQGKEYQILDVDGGDQSGYREANVAVDIGFGDREYWGLTNEYGQLVYVIADEIILQNDDVEPVNESGRYYDDEAYVPGVEDSDLDQGHVIADSLGGVANAYNITPQNSTLNRSGDQAYMEKIIRDAGGCTSFIAKISYANRNTQIPSHYHFEYYLYGKQVVDDFDNVDPSEISEGSNFSEENAISAEDSTFDEIAEVNKIDTNGNGQVSIKEAIAAGYTMPIYSDEWLYKYMTDGDGDGVVGE